MMACTLSPAALLVSMLACSAEHSSPIVERGGAAGIAAGSVRVVDDSTVDITPVFPNRRLRDQLVHPNYGIAAAGSDPAHHPPTVSQRWEHVTVR